MRLTKHHATLPSTPPALVREGAATAQPGNKQSRTAGDGPSYSGGLEPALTAARDLLISTVEAVNPGTPRGELLAYVTQYRARLADLVAACPTAGSGSAS